MTTYLVTGAAGFIGRSIAERLLSDGHSVRGIDNFSTGKHENLTGLGSMRFIEGDVTDAAIMDMVCTGVDVIFHEAALASVPRSVINPIGSNHANVTGTIQLLESARKAKVGRVVFAASSSAYGDTPTLPKSEDMLPNPLSPYAASKVACEYYMRAFYHVYGLETVCIRYFNVFGPYQDPNSQYSGVLAKFISQMLRGDIPNINGDGEHSRDFTFIDNVVNANILAAVASAGSVAGRVFNVAMGNRVTLNQMVAVLREMTGYSGPVLHGPARQGDVRDSLADIRSACEGFGYEPIVSFEKGLRRTVEWCRNQLSRVAAPSVSVDPAPLSNA